MENPKKNCACCGQPVRGRSDKKFCDDNCRNIFNNQRNAPENNYVRKITHALKKNRRLLKEILGDAGDSMKASKEELLDAGFQFRYFTHTSQNSKGGVYFHCYEYAYRPLQDERMLIVRKKHPAHRPV